MFLKRNPVLALSGTPQKPKTGREGERAIAREMVIENEGVNFHCFEDNSTPRKS